MSSIHELSANALSEQNSLLMSLYSEINRRPHDTQVIPSIRLEERGTVVSTILFVTFSCKTVAGPGSKINIKIASRRLTG
jgi:hypothetical protein